MARVAGGETALKTVMGLSIMKTAPSPGRGRGEDRVWDSVGTLWIAENVATKQRVGLAEDISVG